MRRIMLLFGIGFMTMAIALTAVQISGVFAAGGNPPPYSGVTLPPMPFTYWTHNRALTWYAGGTGTSSDPFIISSPELMARLTVNTPMDPFNPNAYYRITQSIDMGTHVWTSFPFNDPFIFTGKLYADSGVTIYNLRITHNRITGAEMHSGLFHTIGDGAEIENLTFTDAIMAVSSSDF